jgi:S1-C subfamily serine protease
MTESRSNPRMPPDDPAAEPAAGQSHQQPVSWSPSYAASFSPAPEPRPDWVNRTGDEWTSAGRPTEEWRSSPGPGGPSDPAGGRPGNNEPGGRGGRGATIATLLTACLLSAVLASGGTFLTLSATGALDQRAPATTAPGGSQVAARQPVTLEESSAIIEAAAAVSPAVVRIHTTATDPDQIVGEIPDTGIGSGVIFDANGWILTNRHVVEGSGGLIVELKDGSRYTGRVYGIDTLTDLAIVKIDETGLATAPVGDSDSLKVGQLVIAIGSPLGTYSNTVTSGIVSAKGRAITVETGQRLTNLIQTDAAINPGNSGGPLLDAAGNVIGINTAVARGSNGIGFAIPINIARPILRQALAGQELARPYIGVRYVPINAQVAREESLPVQTGALVDVSSATGAGAGGEAVEPGSPADQAGLQQGDIITAIESQPIDDEHPLDALLTQYAPGQTIRLEVLRDGNRQTVSVTLGTRPADL